MINAIELKVNELSFLPFCLRIFLCGQFQHRASWTGGDLWYPFFFLFNSSRRFWVFSPTFLPLSFLGFGSVDGKMAIGGSERKWREEEHVLKMRCNIPSSQCVKLTVLSRKERNHPMEKSHVHKISKSMHHVANRYSFVLLLSLGFDVLTFLPRR